jgi:hypothetical protein
MFSVGDLVKWYEMYGDIQVTKDSGIGVILSIMEVCYGDNKQTIYKVFRNEKQDILMLEEHCIQKF